MSKRDDVDTNGFDGERLRLMEMAVREMGKSIGEVLVERYSKGGKRMGFALMIFDFDGPAFVWTSNAQRADMVKALQEFINRNPPDVTSEQRN